MSAPFSSITPAFGAGFALKPGALVRLFHRDTTVKYAVDCRMLFMGERIRRVARAFAEVAYHYSLPHDAAEIARRLRGSPEIAEIYEIAQRNGDVSVLLRDSIFREPGPIDELDLVVEITDGRRSIVERLPVERLRALGALLPLLRATHGAAAVAESLRSSIAGDDAEWAVRLFDSAKDAGVLTLQSPPENPFTAAPRAPEVTLLSHSTLLVRSRRGALVVDPVLRADLGTSPSAWSLPRAHIDAIVCSHGHWDHCDLQTLLWFDKSTPIIVPRVHRPSIFNPPIVPALRLLGFTDVREADPWTPIAVADLELVPVPFHGEQDEPGAEIDHFTYVVRTEGFSVYGGVDCFRDSFGEMAPVLERVKRDLAPDVAFLPVSKITYQFRYGGVNGFCRYLDRSLFERDFQYTAGVADAVRFVEALQPRWVCPYAIFAFPRWSKDVEVDDLARALAGKSLDDRLFPLLPGDTLGTSDLTPDARSRLRRALRLAWFRYVSTSARWDRALRARAPYRALRRVARGALVALGMRT